MPFSFGDDPFHAGDSATIQCTVSHGDLPLNITWSFNDRQVSSSVTTAQVTARVNVLTIEQVSAAHVGNYSCHAYNAAGNTSQTSQLLVNGLTSLHIILAFFFKFHSSTHIVCMVV